MSDIIKWNEAPIKATEVSKIFANELVVKKIKDVLPTSISPQRYAGNFGLAIIKNPTLLNCTNQSLLACAIECAKLGLMPDGLLGEAYIIPYNGKAQFQIGYKGLLKLVRNSGKVKNLVVNEVYQGDIFEYSLIDGIKDHKRTDLTEQEVATHFYALIQYKDGGADFCVLTKKEAELHATKYSKNTEKDTSIWKKNFNAMAKKTALIKACKFAELSTEVQQIMGYETAIEAGVTQDIEFNIANDLGTENETSDQKARENFATAREENQNKIKNNINNINL